MTWPWCRKNFTTWNGTARSSKSGNGTSTSSSWTRSLQASRPLFRAVWFDCTTYPMLNSAASSCELYFTLLYTFRAATPGAGSPPPCPPPGEAIPQTPGGGGCGGVRGG